MGGLCVSPASRQLVSHLFETTITFMSNRLRSIDLIMALRGRSERLFRLIAVVDAGGF